MLQLQRIWAFYPWLPLHEERQREKVLQATSDHEASDDDDEFCLRKFFFMAYNHEDLHDMEEVDQGQLQLAFDELYFNSLDLARKNKDLKLQVEKIINENTQLIGDNQKLKEETQCLHSKVLHITSKLKEKEDILKFGERSKVLDKIICLQQSP